MPVGKHELRRMSIVDGAQIFYDDYDLTQIS